MAKNFEHVSHIKSKLPKENINPEEFYGLTPTVDNSDAEGSSPIKVKFPKLPTEDNLIYGEIAVNYLKGHETLSIKNTEDEIVGFVNENEFFQAQEIISSALGQEKNDRIESIAKIEEKLALKANSADLATVATSGSYNDLKDKPVIPEGAVVDVALSDTSENPVQNKIVKAAIDAKQDVISDLETIRSGAARGATSYQKPSTGIPASDIADGVIPTVPTNVSAFNNDAGYLTEHQSLDKYYTKDEVYSKTESDAKYATKEEMNAVDGKFVEVNQKIDDNELVISAALNDLNASIIKHNDETYTKQEVNDLTSNFFDKAIYDSDNKAIIFKNGDDVIATIDANGFIKDGMVSNVEISESNLVITFNTDAGKAPISIALTDIFNPANYYNKTAMDGKLADYPTISTMNTALGQKANVTDVYTQTEINNKLDAKANSADLAKVATSGSYNDLKDKPVIPEGAVVDAALSDTSENPVQNKVVKAAIDAKQDTILDLATIRSGAELGATAYQKPSNGIPASDIEAGVIPTVPTNVSAFTNDAGYLTKHQSLDNYYTKLEVDNQFDEIEYTVSASLNDLNARIEEMSSDNTNQFTAINERITDFDEGIDDLELAVSSSLNDLNTRIEELSTDNTNKFTAIDERMTYFDEGIDDLELIVSSSLNDLNTRVETNLSTINSLLNKIDELTQRVTALEAKTSAE